MHARQVDTHVHHSACMHQKHLLRFIKSKLRKEPDEVVIFRDGKWLTLKEVFESLHLTGCGFLPLQGLWYASDGWHQMSRAMHMFGWLLLAAVEPLDTC